MLNTFFIALQQDPILSRVKLIAEPWDVGQGGYQVGISHINGQNGMENIGIL